MVFDNNIRSVVPLSSVSADRKHIPENCYHVIFFHSCFLVGVLNRNFDVTVSADTLMIKCSNIVMSGYELCFSKYWTTKDSIIDSST